MKYYALVNSGLEEIAEIEIAGKRKVYPNVIEFSSEKVELQSVRRLLIAIDKYKNLDNLEFPEFAWENYFDGKTFKIEVENVKGQENRLVIAKKVAEKIFEKKINSKIEFKKPDFLVVVFFNGDNYFIGIDLNIEELNSRKYRVFPHSASFKGDLAYYFVKSSGFKVGEKLLVGFCKDGAIAIEAYKYCKEKVSAFDESTPNFIAAGKNAKIAKADLDLRKCALDDLDVKYSENYFDRIILHITSKDEDKINEIYYQAKYILKSKGTLLLIGRENWQFSISDKFKLIEEKMIRKGDSIHKIWLLEKR